MEILGTIQTAVVDIVSSTFSMGSDFLVGALSLAVRVGLILSFLMLIDCIRRNREAFPPTFFAEGHWNKIAWVSAMVITTHVFGAGAIAYYIMVKRPERKARVTASGPARIEQEAE